MFENNDTRGGRTGYYFAKVEIKDCNFMIDEQKVFDQPVQNDLRTYDNIQKVEASQGGGYSTGCLLDYPSFEDIDLSKKQALDNNLNSMLI